MNALIEKRTIYEEALKQLKEARLTEIEKKVAAYRAQLEGEDSEEIAKITKIIDALTTIIDYEDQPTIEEEEVEEAIEEKAEEEIVEAVEEPVEEIKEQEAVKSAPRTILPNFLKK